MLFLNRLWTALIFLVSVTMFSIGAGADYYVTFSEKKISPNIAASPEQLLPSELFVRAAGHVAGDLISLLDWLTHQGNAPTPSERYARKRHYGSWISTASDCKNTRAHVLIRDSQNSVSFTNARECTVDKGMWHDPYSDRDYASAKDVQIDHFVPLKNSYESGGANWDQQKKCMYANFTGNAIHLLPVEGSENNAKGDKAPDGYMPPNKKFSCEYIQRWLIVKTIWQLSMTSSEAEAIVRLFQQNSCSQSVFTLPAAELDRQRALTTDSHHPCYTGME